MDLLAQTASWDNQGGPIPVLITLHSIEDATGTEWDDEILGDDGPNSLSGGDGNDIINGRGGDDQLLGDKQNDSLDGGPGTNHNDGGKGTDTCVNPSTGTLAVGCEH